MQSSPRGGRQAVNARKRPHMTVEYEGTPVRVKQEFSDVPSIPPPYCYDETDTECANEKYGASSGYAPPFCVKTEPAVDAEVAIHQNFTLPSYYTQQKRPESTIYCAPLKQEKQYNGSATLNYNMSTCIGNSPNFTAYPAHEQSSFTFSPWGLATESGEAITFGSLAGVDISKSLEETAEGNVPSERKVHENPKRKLPRSQRRVKHEEEDDGWEPPMWRQQLQNIVKMRETRDAPVDLMGAHKNAEQTTHVKPEVRRYQVLVSLMLSSQTKDQITAQAMTALKNHGLTIENINNTPEEEVARLIHPVGFWRKKAGYIKRVSQILLEKYGGDIPATMDQLCSLPGVGPKMSHLVMDIAWDNTSGIAVDTHVHRISHRLGWMRKETENPEITRTALEKWLPKSEWRELNWLLVGFGQQRCLPTAPKCRGCLNEDICPASKLKGGGPWGKKRKPIKKEVEAD